MQTTITMAAESRAELEKILGGPAITSEDVKRVMRLYDDAVYQACLAHASARATERLMKQEFGEEAYIATLKPITKYGELYDDEMHRYETGELGTYPGISGAHYEGVAVEYQDAGDSCCRCASANKVKFRIRFFEAGMSVSHIEPVEFAWLFFKHDLDIVAKVDEQTEIDVVARSEQNVVAFMDDVNDVYGPLIFEEVERFVDGEWVSILGNPYAEEE